VTNTIQAASESLSAANSRIRDVDVAEETSKMARSQVLMQAGVSVLAQANQMPQAALKLLG
jgi:flagellin